MAILERQLLHAETGTGHGHRAALTSGHASATPSVASNPPTTIPPTTIGVVTPIAGGETGLVERARSGDAEAFDALVVLRLMPTYRLARAILGGMEEAEDATQEAFIAAWRGLPSLRKPEHFDAWFGRIVVNACRMSMRRRPRAVVVSIESIADGQPALAEDPRLNGLVDSDALNRAIDGLPVQQRAILALYYLEDRPVSGVARILGIPIGTVKWRLYRARTALKRAMAADAGRASVLARSRREGPRPVR